MGLRLIGPINTGVAAGGAGTATNNASTSTTVSGEILGIYLKYNDSPPAGTADVVVKTLGTGSGAPPTNTILTVADAATSGWFYPRHLADSEAGAALNTAGDELRVAVPVHDVINVAIAQANNGDSVDAWILVRE